MASVHDIRYKKLFSHPGFMERLLNSFVDEEFVKDLDFSTLKRIDKYFCIGKLQREGIGHNLYSGV